MLLKLASLDNPALRAIAENVTDFTSQRRFAYDMYRTMIHYGGVGLAAPQVIRDFFAISSAIRSRPSGYVEPPVKMFIIAKEHIPSAYWGMSDADIIDENFNAPLPFHVFINPQLLLREGKTAPMEEGCLSIPNVLVQIKRPKRIVFSARNLRGQEFGGYLGEVSARIFCHEYDHLFGKLIIDY